MESIYEPERFKASDVIILKEYFTQYTSLIAKDLAASSKDSEEKILVERNIMGINVKPSKTSELEESCNLDLLLCEGELNLKKIEPAVHSLRTMVLESLPFTQKYSDLEVLKTKNNIEKYRSCEKLVFSNKENFHRCITEKDEESTLNQNLSPGSDFVMNVFFYKPFKFDFNFKNGSWRCRFSHEIQMLGTNTLTELRDKIICSSDVGLHQEVESPTADISHLLNAKEQYPSGCFFIDGVFYNDMRSHKAIEYSTEIIKWGKARNIGDFKTADMHTTKLVDLSLRFGYPYVYIHQGDCEHIMVFSDAHILTVNDCLNSQMYPRLYAICKTGGIICFMCNVSNSKWLVKDYDRLPQSNSYLCANCAKNYCTMDGKKIGEFKLYPVFNNL